MPSKLNPQLITLRSSIKLLLYTCLIFGLLTQATCTRSGSISDWKLLKGSLAEITTTCSPNLKFCLKVFPRNRLSSRPCHAVLSVWNSDKPVWDMNLVNTIAPNEVFVSNDGKRVVTVDEWKFGGGGVVIYGPDGKVIREFALEDLMTSKDIVRYTNNTMHSFSWRHDAVLSPDKNWLVLTSYDNPNNDYTNEENTYTLNTVIDINTAKVLWSDIAKPPPKRDYLELLWKLFAPLGLLIILCSLYYNFLDTFDFSNKTEKLPSDRA